MTHRYDQASGLNFHDDAVDAPRPERHGFDKEWLLGETMRDTRAGAESGRDFTVLWDRRASKMHGPLLNSVLYGVEGDLAYFARRLGRDGEARAYEGSAARRRDRMNRLLWNEQLGTYVNYDRERRQQVTSPVSVEGAYALWAGVASAEQAPRIAQLLEGLLRDGGLMASSDVQSTHQWDGAHGWAIDQIVAVQGLDRYAAPGNGLKRLGDRIARAWLSALALIHGRYGSLPESVDVSRVDRPAVDGTKYPVQEGFLWTNASLIEFYDRLYGGAVTALGQRRGAAGRL
jgi:alpha,alpha-trehalase